MVWLGRDKCALRLLELPYLPSLGGSPLARRGSLRADGADADDGGGGGGVHRRSTSGGGVHLRSTSDGLPTGGTGDAFRLAGTLHKKSQRSGLFQKREVVVESSTLRYYSLKSETPDVLSGGNIERLEVRPPARSATTLARTHARTHARARARRTHARTHARAHGARTRALVCSPRQVVNRVRFEFALHTKKHSPGGGRAYAF